MKEKTIIAAASVALFLLTSMLFATGTLAASAPDNLPQPDPTFHGKIGETYHDSTADK